jgi:mismatch-specific thymine-DNA glycosylase
MKNYKIKIKVDNKDHYTLADILPDNEKLDILFIAKTPANVSVEAGHYFQGKQGTMFWNRLSEYNILKFPIENYADNYLLSNNYGITDIVKVPRDYGNEPSDEEYKQGVHRILETIKKFNPTVIVFVYKTVLDKIINLKFDIINKSNYGFNPQLEKYFSSKVFVFPMPGTPCKSEEAKKAMLELKKVLKK